MAILSVMNNSMSVSSNIGSGGSLENKWSLSDTLGHKKGRCDTRPASNCFPMILRPYQGSRLFYGLPIKRAFHEEWDFTTNSMWVRAAISQLGFWEVERATSYVEGNPVWSGFYFSAKKVDTFHYSEELPHTSMWACKKWRASYYETLPEILIQTLRVINKKLILGKRFTIEVSGKDRIIDLHKGWNAVYSGKLEPRKVLDIHVGWTFDRQHELAERWTPIEYDSLYSVQPTHIGFQNVE